MEVGEGTDRMTGDKEEPHLAWLRNLIRGRGARKRDAGGGILQINFFPAGLFGGRGKLTHRTYGYCGIGKSCIDHGDGE